MLWRINGFLMTVASYAFLAAGTVAGWQGRVVEFELAIVVALLVQLLARLAQDDTRA